MKRQTKEGIQVIFFVVSIVIAFFLSLPWLAWLIRIYDNWAESIINSWG